LHAGSLESQNLTNDGQSARAFLGWYQHRLKGRGCQRYQKSPSLPGPSSRCRHQRTIGPLNDGFQSLVLPVSHRQEARFPRVMIAARHPQHPVAWSLVEEPELTRSRWSANVSKMPAVIVSKFVVGSPCRDGYDPGLADQAHQHGHKRGDPAETLRAVVRRSGR